MKTFTIVGGVDGAGKSSLIGILKAERNDLGNIIDVDKLASANGGNYLRAAGIAIVEIRYFLERHISFTQEATLSGHVVEHTVQKAREAEYEIHLYYVGLSSAEESIRRIKNRVRKGGHNIPDNNVLRRYHRRFSSLARILPYCDRAKFYDNENQFSYVAEYRNGKLIFKSNYRPQWIEELKNHLEKQVKIGQNS